MTWCSKIYDIFNGMNEEKTELPSSTINNLTEAAKIRRINSDFYRPANESTAAVQHERSSFSTNDSTNEEPVYFEQVSSSYQQPQYDEGYFYNPNHQPYTLATISNMSLNLPMYIENTQDDFQKQLARSYSMELPMEVKKTTTDDRSIQVRYSTNLPRTTIPDKHTRLSLNHASTNHSQLALRHRQESLGYRVSTCSTQSVPDYESNELQSQNAEQIERAVQTHIKEMLTSSPGGVFPMVYRLPPNQLPNRDRYRVEGGYGEPSQWLFKTKILPTDCRIISDNVSAIYSNHFYDQYHYNLYAIDNSSNPVVMSVKPHDDKLTVIVRTKEGSKCMDFVENGSNLTDYVDLSKRLYPSLCIDHFENCTSFKAQQLIKAFDDKLETTKFKFGVIYQRRGQTTEEEFFNNETHHPNLNEFLSIIATKVQLKNFQGYRGGLDVSEKTESPISYYECYDHKEIMFHVSTLLPFSSNDSIQIQRKRHIGNDIVTIVFQEENTPFHPSMVKSNFLHVFLVVQPVQILSRTCYKMMLVTRNGIEEFPPLLQPNVVYVRTAEQLKPFVLTKLINAEYAAYRCRTFSLLQERTRCSYLKSLCEGLAEKSYEILCDEHKRVTHRRLSLLSNSTRKRYLSSMKKMFTRSNTVPEEPRQSIKSDRIKIKTSKKLLRLGKSMDSVDTHQRPSIDNSSSDQSYTRENDFTHRRVNGRSDESLNSSADMTSSTYPHHYPGQVYYADESDEGLDSMSSADTTRAPYDSDDQDTYRQQLREKSHPTQIWQRVSTRRHIYTPQTAGIHISEEATV